MAEKKSSKTGGNGASSLKERLTLLESQFESIFTHSRDSLIVVNRDGMIVFANPAACRLFNSDESPLIGKPFGYPVVRDEITDLDVPQKGKCPLTVEMRSSETVWNNEKAWLVTLRDVTDSKHTEEALNESLLQFKRLVQNVPGVVYRHINRPDGSGRFHYISPQCKDIYELDQQTILEDETTLWKCHHPDETAELVRILREHVKSLETLDWEGRIVTPSGKIKWVHVTCRPQKQLNGDLIWDGIILDITDKKIAESQVLKLSAAVDQSANAIILTDRNGTIEYVNRKFTAVTGYTFDEAVGQNPRVLKSDVHTPEFFKQLWDTISSDGKWTGELCNRKKNGELYWEFATINPIKDANGQTVNYIAIKKDITAEKQARLALREQEKLIRSVFKTLHSGICITDKDGLFVEVNEAYCRMYGYTRENLIGKSFTMVVPEKDRPYMQALHDAFIEGKAELPQVAEVTRKNGTLFWIEFSGGLLIHENGTRFKVTSVTDIADRQRAESALRQSEEKFRQIIETSYEGIWLLDQSGHIEFLNKRMAEMLGYTMNEVIGKYVGDFILEQDMTGFISYIQKSKRDIAETRDFRFRRKDGSTLWGLVSIRAKIDGNGTFRGALGMVSDITERKQAEDDLKHSQQRLKRFFDQTFLAVIEGNLSFEITDWNPAAEKIFGYRKEEVIGKNGMFLIAEDDLGCMEEAK